MSIEIAGPQGFEYQYQTTVFIVLKLLGDPQEVTAVYVEKIDGEDIELHLSNTSGNTILEIQVKREENDLDIEKLATWLCHFETHAADSCTLSRLTHTENRKFIIATQSRCTDDVKALLVRPGVIDRKQIGFPLQSRKLLLESIKEAGETLDDTDLGNQRKMFCASIALELKNASLFKKTINKVFVWEKQYEPTLINEIRLLLNERYQVPQSQAGHVLLLLVEAVKKGRNDRTNILDAIKHLLDANKGTAPPVNPFYIKRPDEDSLLADLIKNGTMLLKGNSFSGKTTTSISLCKALYDQGYTYLQPDSVSEATRLLSPSTEDKICFIDDPFGHVYESLHSQEYYKQAYDLIKKLKPNHKLVLTANNEVLRKLNTDIYPLDWVDLTVTDRAFAIALWKNACSQKEVPEEIEKKVTLLLERVSVDNLLQAGQLEFLANNYKNLENWTDKSILEFASIGSDRIAARIRNELPEKQRVFRVLGLVATTLHGVGVEELKYIFSTTNSFPGFLKHDPGYLGTSLFGPDKSSEIKFPVYEAFEPAEIDLDDALDFFEEHGYIIYENGKYRFKHPVYYHASLRLFKDLPKNKLAELIADFKKSLAILDPECAITASRKFDNLYTACKLPEQKKQIVLIANEASKSIFPSVQDNSLTFLVSVSAELDNDQLEFVERWLAERESDVGSIFWHDGMPFFNSEKSTTYSTRIRNYFTIDKPEFNNLIGKLQSDGPLLSPQDAWKIANYIQRKSKKKYVRVNQKALSRLLLYNESFIREIAAFHIMFSSSDPDMGLVDRIFSDAHPNVVFQAFKGSFRGWIRYNKQTKAKVFEVLKAALGRNDVCIRAKNFMTQFSAGHTSYTFDWKYHIPAKAKPLMWKLWANLMPVFFEKIPGHIHFNDSRFVQTFKDSVDLVTIEQKVELSAAWYKWLNKSNKKSYGNSNLYYVTDYFLSFFDKLHFDNRTDLSLKLLSDEAPYFIAYTLRKFISRWDKLNSEEKQAIKSRLATDPYFVLKSVALTTESLPDDLTIALTGRGDFFTLAPDLAFASINEQLFIACLVARFGHNYYSELAHGNKAFWPEVITYFVANWDVRVSEFAVKVMLQNYLWAGERSTWNDAPVQVEALLKKAVPEITQIIKLVLLDDLCGINWSQSISLVKIFFEVGPEPEIVRFKTEILENAETIIVNNNREVFNFFKDEELTHALMVDDLILQVYNLATSIEPTAETVAMFETLVEKTINKIRDHRSLDIMEKFFDKYGIENTGLRGQIREERRIILERARTQARQIDALLMANMEKFEALL